MRKLGLVLTTLSVVMLLNGCGMLLGRTCKVTIGNSYEIRDCDTYAILPFIDQRKQTSQLKYNASEAMTDAFETEFIGSGFKVVDRRNIQSALDEMKFSYQGDVDPDQRKQIGKLTNSDVMIIGKLRTFQNALYENRDKPKKATKCTTISIYVKAVHIESGEILWTGSLTQSAGIKEDFFYPCGCNVLTYANKAAGDIVKKIVKESVKKQKKS